MLMLKNLLHIIPAVWMIVSFHATTPVIIKPGLEVDQLRLGRSLAADAFRKYGNNTGFTQGIACGYQDYYTNRFHFSQGITVITETINRADKIMAPITKIGVSYPCNAETSEGINLLRNNSDDIIKIYGKPETTYVSQTFIDLHYTSKGISFRCCKAEKDIRKIEIYVPGSSCDFWY